MATTFDASLPTWRDRARLILADTGPAYLLTDESLDALRTALGESEGLACAAEAMATKIAQSPDSYAEGVGLRVEWKSRVAALYRIADKARAGVFATGRSATASTLALASAITDPIELSGGIGEAPGGLRTD